MKWLLSVDGGSKSKKSATQNARQVETILSMAPLKADDIRTHFLEEYCPRNKFLPSNLT